MNYSAEEKERFKFEFRTGLKKRLCVLGGSIITLVCIALFADTIPENIRTPVVVSSFFGMATAASILAGTFKCPACGKKPGKSILVKACKNRGIELR